MKAITTTLSEESLNIIERNVKSIMSNERILRGRSEDEIRADQTEQEIKRISRSGKTYKKFASRRDFAEAVIAPTSIAEYTRMFAASKWNQNSIWMLAEKNLPSANNEFTNSLVKQFLSGKQLSEKQAYYLAKAKVEQA